MANVDIAGSDTLQESRANLRPLIDDERQQVRASSSMADFGTFFAGEAPLRDQADLDLRMNRLLTETTPGSTAPDEILRQYRDYRRQRLEPSFAYLQLGQSRAEADQHREQIGLWDKAFSGPENVASLLPADQKPAFDAVFASSLRPDEEKKQTVNRLFVENATGQPVDSANWPVMRSQFAQQNFGAGGPVDESTFYKLAGDYARKEKADYDMSEKVSRMTTEGVMQALPLAEVSRRVKEAAGEKYSQFEPVLTSAYSSMLARYSNDVLKTSNEITKLSSLAEGSNVEQGGESSSLPLAQAYNRLSQEDRFKALGLAAANAQAQGATVEDMVDRIGGAFARGARQQISYPLAARFAENDAEALQSILDSGRVSTALKTDFTAEPASFLAKQDSLDLREQMRDLTPEEFKKASAALEGFQGQAKLFRDLTAHSVDIEKYRDDHIHFTWRSIDDGLVMMAESAPTMIVSAIPGGLGLGVLGETYAQRNRSQLEEAGGSDSQADRAVSFVEGLGEAGIDRLEWLTLGAKMPAVSAYLLKFGKAGVVANYAAKTGIKAVAETGQEIAQDLSFPATQSLVAALNSDIQGPDWAATIQKEKESLGDIAAVSLGLSMIGEMGSSIGEHMEANKLRDTLADRQGLQLAGYDLKTANTIAQAAESNPLRAAELLKQAQMTTDPEVRRANSQKALTRIQQDSSIASLEAAGIAIPSQNPDGSVTVRQNGQAQNFASMDEALVSIRSREQADNVERSQLNQQMLDYLQSGEETDSPWRFAATLDNPTQTLDDWAGENEDLRKIAYNRAKIYLREGGYDMGLAEDLSKFTILGSNRNEYANGVATTVADISTKGNPLTILEERGEGYWKYILDPERLGADQGLQWVRQFEANSGKEFLPDDFGSKEATLQQQDVVEALSTISVAHATGKIEESQVPAPLKKFFQGIKEVISDILNLAGLVKTLLADGKLDADFRQHLDVAAGIDVNGEFANARSAADRQVALSAQEALQQELQGELSGESFSVALESDPVVAQILNQAKGTEEQIAVFEKLAETARDINARAFDSYGYDRDVAALNQQEQAEIIAARERILAKYGDDIEKGTNKQKIADIRRETEGRIRDRYNNERAKIQNRQETAQDRFDKQRDIALLESITKALPAEIRGRLVGDFKALDQLQTPEGRERYLVDLLPKVQAGLEEHLQSQYRDAISKLFDKAEVKVSEARTRGGKITAEGHAIFDAAKAAIPYTLEQVDSATEPLRQRMESEAFTEKELADLDAQVAAIELFGDYENADASRLKDAHALLQGVYQEGRQEWLGTLKARSDVRRARVDQLIRGVGGDPSRPLTDVERNASRTPGLFKKLDEGTMAAFLSGSQTLRRLAEATGDTAVKGIVEEMEYAFLESELTEGDMNRSDEHALKLAMQSIFKTNSVYGVSKKLHELSQMAVTSVEKVEGRHVETVSMPKNVVESILSGEVDSIERKGEKIELSDKDRVALQAASDAFDQLPEKQQNRKKNISFERTISEGERMTLGSISQLEGLQLWLTMRQPDQFSKLQRLGYDQETMDQLTGWLKPETQALGLWMVQHIGAETFTLDALHRMEKGVGLKLVDQYFPVRNDVQRASNGDLSLDGNAPQFTGKSAGFAKERVKNNASPAYVNAVAVFLANRAQVNFWKAHVSTLREWGGVIKDERFAATIKAKMGADYYQALNQRLARIESGGSLNAKRGLQMEALVKNLTRNFALGTLGLRASTIAVNLSAGLNFTLEMPITDIAKGAAELAANPKSFADAFNSPAIQRRWKEGATVEAKLAKSQGPSSHPALATLNSWAEHGLAPINWADTGAQLVGSAIAYEHARKAAIASGASEDEAKVEANKRVERLLLRAAQPTTRLAKSELELSLAENPLAAMGTMFFSDPRKNLAILYLAGREILTGKGTNGKGLALQQLVVGGLVLGATEFLIRSTYQALVKADDSDDPEFGARWLAKVSDPKAWLYALTTSQLKSVPVAGEAFNQMMAKATGQKAFAAQNPLSGAVGKAVEQATKLTAPEKEGHEKTREDIIDGAIKVVQGFGSAIPGGAIFSQLANAGEFLEGLNSSNGVSVSDEERVKRIDARFGKFEKELNAKLGKTEDEKGKVNKALKRQKDHAKADQLDALLQPLSPELRKQALEQIKPSKEVRSLLKFK